MFNQIVFPPYEGLPFEVKPPKIDGYVEPEKLERPRQTGTPTTSTDFGHPSEVGYTHGARFSPDEGAGTGFAVAAFQGVWDAQAGLLYLGFIVRYALSFNLEDRVLVALRQGQEFRRIDIQPNSNDGGASGADDPAPLPQPTVHVRTGRDPGITPVSVYRSNPPGTTPLWKPMTPPAPLQVKVRTIREESPPSDGRYWSVELTIPTQSAGGPNPGGGDWLTLNPQFGLYVNLIRFGAGTTTLETLPSIQATWPYDPANPEAFVIADQPGADPRENNWLISTYGQATLLAPGQPNPGRGVKFENGVSSIGVLQADNSIGGVLDMRTVGTVNKLVARLVNTDVTNPAPSVLAEFRLAEFGVGGGMPGVWDKVPSVSNPSAAVQVPSSASGTVHADLTSDWTITQADRDKYVGLWNDQCLWVHLTATAPTNFVEASMRRNLTVKLMSEYNGGFVVHGSGYPRPPSGEHDFLLHSVKVPVALTGPDPVVDGPGPEIRPLHLNLAAGLIREAGDNGEGGNGNQDGNGKGRENVAWIWVTNAYRDTGRTLTLGRRRTRVYVHAGSFGHLFVHTLQAGETPQSVDLAVDFRGGGIEVGRDGLSTLRVRDGDKAVVATSFRSVPAGEPHHGGDDSGQNFLRWLLALLRRLLDWLLRRNRP